MTDEERFLAVLEEVHALLLQLGDLKARAVVIGGHVVALHGLALRGSAAIETETGTGVVVSRGFTHEPDLLFDLDADTFSAERLPEVLKLRGYKRHRDFRWGRTLESGVLVELDLFRSPELDDLDAPLSMTALPDAATVLRSAQTVAVRLGDAETFWRVPDPFGFLSMKVRAELEQRPQKHKDCFDMYVLVKLLGVEAVRAALDAAPERAHQLRGQRTALFCSLDAPGVLDVLYEAGLTESAERDLLARDVVDTFADVAST